MNPIIQDVSKALGLFVTALAIIVLFNRIRDFMLNKMKGGAKFNARK